MKKILFPLGCFLLICVPAFGQYADCHKWRSCTAQNWPDGLQCGLAFKYTKCDGFTYTRVMSNSCQSNVQGTDCHCTCLTANNHKGTSVSYIDSNNTLVVNTNECVPSEAVIGLKK